MIQPQNSSLQRKLGLKDSLALNVTNMIGIGPFITIPLFLSAVGEPSALWGWVLGAILAMADGFLWSELAAAHPYSGGTYHYLRKLSGPVWGPRLAFLFLWQFVISGPLEIASGCVGLAQYASYLHPFSHPFLLKAIAMITVLIALWLLSREVDVVGQMAVGLAVVVLGVCLFIVWSGLTHSAKPLGEILRPMANVHLSWTWMIGLGHATTIAIYDYLGYYNVCYAAEEVKNPEKTIPLSILWALILVGILYFSINLSILRVLPWQEASSSSFVVSTFMERLYGMRVAKGITLLILITAFASVFSLLAAYARIVYAASRAGDFFSSFGEVHPIKKDPRKALWLIGTFSALACLIDLSDLIAACVAIRILIQFLGQVGLVWKQRRRGVSLPYHMPLYPLPLLVALVGWNALLWSSEWKILGFAAAITLSGTLIALCRKPKSETFPKF
ncbi:MAG: APC family permease [Elusimicrobia bacterium]|nr:APC family permease [Elusimicrobiota bacterium]